MNVPMFSGFSARTLCFAMLAIVVITAHGSLLPTSLQAQIGRPQPPPREPAKMTVYYLKHVNAQQMENIVNVLMGETPNFRCIAEGADRLIVSAAPKQHEAVQEMLMQLDQLPQQEPIIKIFSLQNCEAHAVAELVQQLVREVAVAVDVRTNSLVVTGEMPDLEVVETLLLRLDEQDRVVANVVPIATSHKLEMFWLMEAGATDSEPSAARMRKPDQQIGEAVAELQRQGFGDLRQVGQVGVVVRTGGNFRVSSPTWLGQLDAQGALKQGPDRQLELVPEINISKDGSIVASISTEIITQPDHNVVIGVAGATPDQPDRRSAFVIRVSK